MKCLSPSLARQRLALATLLIAGVSWVDTSHDVALANEPTTQASSLPNLSRTIRKVAHYAAIISIDTGNETFDGITENTMRTLIDRYETIYRAPKVDDQLKDKNEMTKLARFYAAVLSQHEVVDVYIFKHTNSEYLALQRVPLALRKRLRLIYNSGCRNEGDAMAYLALGIEAFIGHRGISSSPIFNIPFVGCFAGNTKFLSIPLPFLNGESEPLKECVKRGNTAIQNIFVGNEATIGDGFTSYISNLDTGQNYTPEQVREASYGHLYGNTETRVDEKRDINENDLLADFDLTQVLRKDKKHTNYLRAIADQNEIDFRFRDELERQTRLNLDFQKFYRLFRLERSSAPLLSPEETALLKKNSYNGVVALSNITVIDFIVSAIKDGQSKEPDQREFDDNDFKYRYFTGRLSTRMNPAAAAEWSELLFRAEMTPDRKKQIAWASVQIERMRALQQSLPEKTRVTFTDEREAFPFIFSQKFYRWDNEN